MRRISHLVFGLGSASLLTSDPILLALAAIFSILPDFDWPLCHRGWFSHSLFSAGVLSAAGLFASGWDLRFPILIFLALSSHLFLDFFTKSGIPLLYPWREESFGLRVATAHNRAMNAAFQLAGVVMLTTGIFGFSFIAG